MGVGIMEITETTGQSGTLKVVLVLCHQERPLPTTRPFNLCPKLVRISQNLVGYATQYRAK